MTRPLSNGRASEAATFARPDDRARPQIGQILPTNHQASSISAAVPSQTTPATHGSSIAPGMKSNE